MKLLRNPLQVFLLFIYLNFVQEIFLQDLKLSQQEQKQKEIQSESENKKQDVNLSSQKSIFEVIKQNPYLILCLVRRKESSSLEIINASSELKELFLTHDINDIKVIYVDIEQNFKLIEKYDLFYRTNLYFFIGEVPISYEGKPTGADMLEWIISTKKWKPWFISNDFSFKQTLKGFQYLVFYLPDAKEKYLQIITGIKNLYKQQQVFYFTNFQLAKNQNLNENLIGVFYSSSCHGNQQLFQINVDNFSVYALMPFLNHNEDKQIHDFSLELGKHILNEHKKTLIFFSENLNSKKGLIFKQFFQQHENKEEIYFVMSDPWSPQAFSLLTHFNMDLQNKKEFVLLLTFKGKSHVYLYENMESYILEQLVILTDQPDKQNIQTRNIAFNMDEFLDYAFELQEPHVKEQQNFKTRFYLVFFINKYHPKYNYYYKIFNQLLDLIKDQNFYKVIFFDVLKQTDYLFDIKYNKQILLYYQHGYSWNEYKEKLTLQNIAQWAESQYFYQQLSGELKSNLRQMEFQVEFPLRLEL